MPLTVAPRDRTLPVILGRQGARFPDRPLLIAGDVVWTYGQALSIARRAATTLAAADVRAGDSVAILCGNRAEFLQAFLGCAFLGAVAVPINIASRGDQLRHILTNCGARLMVAEAGLFGVVAPLLGTPGIALARIWLIGGDAPAVPPGVTVEPFALGAAGEDPAPVRPGDPVAILYTSGTTGLSKGVLCPQAQYYWWGINSADLLGIVEGDVLMTSLPLFHTNALNAFYQAMLTGTTLAVEPRFSASGFWPALCRHRATVTYLLGAMVPILLARPESAEDRAHGARIALAPGVPEGFHTPFRERFGIHLLDGYGSTETNFVIGSPQGEHRPGTMGRLQPDFEVRVVDEEDAEVPDGTAGELVARAKEPFAFASGYVGMPDKTVETWRNLWFHSGDRVIRDPDGYYRFIDRAKDAIRRRGENISAYEVEQVVLAHPAVATAAVFPVRSELAEDEVMVALVLRPGVALTPAELLDHCQPRLPYFAVPRYVELVAELPATENGKIQKFKLRERGVTSDTWDREAHGYKVSR
jgi:crotonobetaine/carnitine-CoA ligase